MLRLFVVLLLSLPLLGGDWYLFTSFRRNGETGVFFALSQDGKTWSPLNGNKPWLAPDVPGMLMRDPWLGQGPDGVWHMLWTVSWTSPQIGYAESKDLIHWSAQRQIPVMEKNPDARNAWAPEAAYDPARGEWTIFWATTIGGKPKEYDHRIYAVTTRDWKTFTATRLFFDPGFSSIDSTIVQDGKRWIMIFKDERQDPVQKRLRLAFADSPAGPWTGVTEPFSRDWIEGPSAVKIGAEWWIYFDHYRKPQAYGAIRTKDWKSFEDVSELVSFPQDHRHGTAVRITDELAASLKTVLKP
jgi:hypothetical protein